MPVRALVVQNDPDKGLGRISGELAGLGVELDVRDSTAALPDPSLYDGLVLLPGLADPVDHTDAIVRSRAAIERALELERPILGLCLGGQLLVQALGGDVYACQPELGLRPVAASPAAAGDPLLGSAPSEFDVFHAHAFAFRPPAGAEVLLENDVCVQACRVDNAWAFQCHPEVTRQWIGELAAAIRGRPSPVGPTTASFFRSHGIDPAELEARAERAEGGMRTVAAGIAAGFAARCAEGASAKRAPQP